MHVLQNCETNVSVWSSDTSKNSKYPHQVKSFLSNIKTFFWSLFARLSQFLKSCRNYVGNKLKGKVSTFLKLHYCPYQVVMIISWRWWTFINFLCICPVFSRVCCSVAFLTGRKRMHICAFAKTGSGWAVSTGCSRKCYDMFLPYLTMKSKTFQRWS